PFGTSEAAKAENSISLMTPDGKKSDASRDDPQQHESIRTVHEDLHSSAPPWTSPARGRESYAPFHASIRHGGMASWASKHLLHCTKNTKHIPAQASSSLTIARATLRRNVSNNFDASSRWARQLEATRPPLLRRNGRQDL